MSWDTAKTVIDLAKSLGAKAVTITGGGEPLCYPHFEELVDYFFQTGIKIGLVTNGLLLHKVSAETLQKVVWCRISSGDDRAFDTKYQARLEKAVWSAPNVDWAFSHVVGEQPNIPTIARVVAFANRNRFTHVRLVADLFIPEAIGMSGVKSWLTQMKVDDSIVIYQPRNQYVRGGDCYICYLKPVIGPDVKVYTCCGVQYALDPPSRDMTEPLCLGSALELDKIIARSNKPFDGSICKKCYYTAYNQILRTMLSEIKHAEFV